MRMYLSTGNNLFLLITNGGTEQAMILRLALLLFLFQSYGRKSEGTESSMSIIDEFLESLDGFSKIAATGMLAILPDEAKAKLESSLVRARTAMQSGDKEALRELLDEYGGMSAIEAYLPAIRTMFPDLNLMLPVGVIDADKSER